MDAAHMQEDWHLISDAILVWVGRVGGPLSQLRGPEALVATYGAEVGLDLIPVVRDLVEEFNSSRAGFDERGVKAIGDRAAAEFRAAHPLVDEEAVQRLANAYSFGFR